MKKRKVWFMGYDDFIKAVPKGTEQEAEYRYVKENFFRLSIASHLFLIIGFFSITVDIFTGLYSAEQPINYLNLTGLIILIIGSLIVSGFGIIGAKKIPSLKTIKLCHFFYYGIIDLCLFLFMINEFYRGNYVNYEQFYWIFFCAVPLMHLRSNIVNVVVSAVVYTTEFIVVSHYTHATFDKFVYFLPVLLLFYFFSLYLRNYHFSNIIFTLRNRQLTEELRSRSRIDSLTGCFNRYVLREHFATIKKNNKSITAFIYDIDDFKAYNDTFSHVTGDECLSDISNVAKKLCTKKYANVYRYGGEEFVVLIADIDENDAINFANEIVVEVEKIKITSATPNKYVTVSLGVAIFDITKDIDLKTIVAEADKQLYIAKSNGKNCGFYKDKRI